MTRHGSLSRRWVISLSLLSGLAIIGCVTAFSTYAWQDYEKGFTVWHQQLRRQTDMALGLPSKTTDDRQKKLTNLISLRQTLTAGATHCDAYRLLQWQRFIPDVDKRLKRCSSLVVASAAFDRDLQAIISHLKAEQIIVATLNPKTPTSELDEAGWKQVSDRWTTISGSLNKQTVPGSVEATRQLAIKKATTVNEAWQALIQANEAKDRAKYEAAISQLAASYDGLQEIAGIDEKSFLPLVQALQKSYDQAFGQSQAG